MNITILSAIAIVFLPSHPILASNSLISAQNKVQQQDTSVTNEVQSHIRAEVQQTFHATFTVLSLLLVLLLFLPTITAIAAWFLLAKLAQKSALAQQEIESLKIDVLSQLETLLDDAKAVLLTAQLPPVISEDIFPETNGHSHILQLDLVQILSQALEPDVEQEIEENLESNLAQADCNQAKLSGDSPSDLLSESVQLNPAQPEPSKLARDYVLQAEKFFLSNQLEAAIDAYNQAIKFDPDSPETWNNRGVVLIKLQRYHEAVASYEQAIQRRTDYADAWNNRGVALG
ncbi:MAG: tetratricopeptide repeat protein, partial [Microcoleaceae cyanobacterium]